MRVFLAFRSLRQIRQKDPVSARGCNFARVNSLEIRPERCPKAFPFELSLAGYFPRITKAKAKDGEHEAPKESLTAAQRISDDGREGCGGGYDEPSST